MKEIKAYIRRSQAPEVVEALERAGAPGITLIDVHAVGYGEEPNFFARADQLFQRYSNIMVKVEIVCADGDLDRLVAIIQTGARTGFQGDGMIFVAEIGRAVRIRNGASGEAALR